MGNFRQSYVFIITFVCYILSVSSLEQPVSEEKSHDCTFEGEAKRNEVLIAALKPLWGIRFLPVEFFDGKKYTFEVGLCTTAKIDSKKEDHAGVIQSWIEETGQPKMKVIGRINETSIQGGDSWILLTYGGGDEYGTHCIKNKRRRAMIMILCDPDQAEPSVKVLEENNQTNNTCYYLLEISTKVVCPPTKSILPEGISAGSAFVIVFVVLASSYLIVGCVYQRFVVGAKGIHQIPNLRIWQEFGNLMADGCNFMCRSKNPGGVRVNAAVPGAGGGYTPVQSSPTGRAYKGLGDDILSSTRPDGGLDAGDDSLLPM